jgi:putative redox protein
MATVTASLVEGTKVTIEARQFTWRADEPPEATGTDTGPTPYELLLGSLAACTATTLSLYANHKGIELESVGVELSFGRVHADDCEDCDVRADGWLERVQSDVTIRGQFDEAQRKRLGQVARRCPVHKTLTNGVQIADSVSFEEGG